MIPQQEILLLAMKAGQIQLENGAEIFRVEDTIMHTFTIGAIVRHFKREYITDPQSAEYLYKILAFASHTETGEKLVIYQALYPPYKTCARPYDMFISEVDHVKYPDIKQRYRFEVINTEQFPV